jgi:hypothetical protein
MSQQLWKDSRLLPCSSRRNLELNPKNCLRTETLRRGVLLQGEVPGIKSQPKFIRLDLILCRPLVIPEDM